jgi:hypothetical protein
MGSLWYVDASSVIKGITHRNCKSASRPPDLNVGLKEHQTTHTHIIRGNRLIAGVEETHGAMHPCLHCSLKF